MVDRFTFDQIKNSRPLSSVTEIIKNCLPAHESRLIKRGIDKEARIPSIASTAINSIRVKARVFQCHRGRGASERFHIISN